MQNASPARIRKRTNAPKAAPNNEGKFAAAAAGLLGFEGPPPLFVAVLVRESVEEAVGSGGGLSECSFGAACKSECIVQQHQQQQWVG